MNQSANQAISRYLTNLRQALNSAPSSAQEDALRDATEFLSNEVDSLDNPLLNAGESEVYDYFVECYGEPSQVAEEYFRNDNTATANPRRWKSIAATNLLLMGLCGAACYAMFREPPKLSPFTEIHFEPEKILVQYEGVEYEWISLDDIPTTKIAASAKEQFSRRWQKRVAEDLVEVLWGMGHSPGKKVQLELRDPQAAGENISVAASMTAANRKAVWRARYEEEFEH